ncbi:MAG: bifunctional proline dehydrogenase/L-glutamate gamma-semialdehyde dehydrogenase PutA [Rickettsiales bacterium]|nr:bifunctional proline dehydrogenase/L-glutamate gamma-semialdehyde dehydrogenase PutA [Rickettsiales bacterium]
MFFLSQNNAIDQIIHDYLNTSYQAESDIINDMIPLIRTFFDENQDIIDQISKDIITEERQKAHHHVIDSLINHYGFDSSEGYALICLAEALLRIPDIQTRDDLIADKLQNIHLESDDSETWFVKSADKAINIAAKLIRKKQNSDSFGKITKEISEPIIRASINKLMDLLGKHFVIGSDIHQSLKKINKSRFLFSFDMLGEAARNEQQARAFLESYKEATLYVGKSQRDATPLFDKNGISVKLSALSPNYEPHKYDHVIQTLLPRLREILDICKKYNIPVIIDAEEARRLDLSLMVLKEIFALADYNDFNGIGIAVQAYNKKILPLMDTLTELAKTTGRIIPVRLVKGAYWDYEIKYSQSQGHAYYPVFTHKDHTDIAYMAAATKLVESSDHLYPQFATHNDCTAAFILALLKDRDIDYEFQKLYGMGDVLYNKIIKEHNIKCREYAPVGKHNELLPYLIRRLVENGANSSFVKQVGNTSIPIEELLHSSLEGDIETQSLQLPCPISIFGDERKNSSGYDLGSLQQLKDLNTQFKSLYEKHYSASTVSTVTNEPSGDAINVVSPHNHSHVVGSYYETNVDDCDTIVHEVQKVFYEWNQTSVRNRSVILTNASNILSSRMHEAAYLLVAEASKTLPNAIAEVREAIDFLRYYSHHACQIMKEKEPHGGITGEYNYIQFHGKGVFVCISPWNFPLAIFTGQIAAALVTGNSVIAKPSEQTNLIAAWMVGILHEAGVPEDVLQMCIGTGGTIGNALVSNPVIKGVCFTGSTQTAHHINQTLANRNAPPATLIAETGGQNCMIIDSSAFIEQAVDDVIMSAFDSAGQRCSALRVLYLQDEIYDHFIEMLTGKLDSMMIGNPARFQTDIGAVIDDKAKAVLEGYCLKMTEEAELLFQYTLQDGVETQGSFVAPCIFRIDHINQLEHEVFGPVLHVIRYQYDALDSIIEQINSTGYGLTFGIHSRLNQRIDTITSQIHAGNIYINQAITGATVGSQPFGGHDKSGTGPKAGGPLYLYRFVNEKTMSINTTSIGGNMDLLSL